MTAMPETTRTTEIYEVQLPAGAILLDGELKVPQGVTFRNTDHAAAALREPLLERAIGVIYRPETERASHYFKAHLSEQFDAVIHFDQTRAVEPLELTAEWETGEVPETFPTGI